MKKVLLLSFILGVFTQSTLFAEVVPVKKKMGEKWGLKLGVGSSSFSGRFKLPSGASFSNMSGSLESLKGISFGLISPYYPLSFNDQLSVHGELLLVLKGFQYIEKGYYTPRNFLFLRQRYSFYEQETHSYLEIPLFLNYQFSKKYGFRGYLGPYVGLIFSRGFKLETTLDESYSFPGFVVEKDYITRNVNIFGFGLATGLSYEWEKFSADLRYETSLTDCFDSLIGKFSTFSVSGSYLF